MIDRAKAYNITTRHACFDGEVLCEARVREFPDLVEYADTFAEAYDLAIDAIATTLADCSERGEAAPAPIEPVDCTYSGRVTSRFTKSLHRRLAERAQSENVSLNHYINTVLANAVDAPFASPESRYAEWHASIQVNLADAKRPRLTVVKNTALADKPLQEIA